MHEYKIDDVARECGLTKRTIRYYEELGVFPPLTGAKAASGFIPGSISII